MNDTEHSSKWGTTESKIWNI